MSEKLIGALAASFFAFTSLADAGQVKTFGPHSTPAGFACSPAFACAAGTKTALTDADMVARARTAAREAFGSITYQDSVGWGLPVNGKGDCAQIAMETKRLAITSGIPAGRLLFAVAGTKSIAGHGIVILRTRNDDWIIDNGRVEKFINNATWENGRYTEADPIAIDYMQAGHSWVWTVERKKPTEFWGSQNPPYVSDPDDFSGGPVAEF